MSTRSWIGRQAADGSVTYIYAHWDGYPAHNGRILVESYTDPAKIDALLALGDLSVLGPELGHRHNFNTHGQRELWDYTADPPVKRLNRHYKRGEDAWCLAYGRDRGETDVAAKWAPSADAYYGASAASWAEYLYLWRAGAWVVSAGAPPAGGVPAWEPVAAVLAAEAASA